MKGDLASSAVTAPTGTSSVKSLAGLTSSASVKSVTAPSGPVISRSGSITSRRSTVSRKVLDSSTSKKSLRGTKAVAGGVPRASSRSSVRASSPLQQQTTTTTATNKSRPGSSASLASVSRSSGGKAVTPSPYEQNLQRSNSRGSVRSSASVLSKRSGMTGGNGRASMASLRSQPKAVAGSSSPSTTQGNDQSSVLVVEPATGGSEVSMVAMPPPASPSKGDFLEDAAGTREPSIGDLSAAARASFSSKGKAPEQQQQQQQQEAPQKPRNKTSKPVDRQRASDVSGGSSSDTRRSQSGGQQTARRAGRSDRVIRVISEGAREHFYSTDTDTDALEQSPSAAGALYRRRLRAASREEPRGVTDYSDYGDEYEVDEQALGGADRRRWMSDEESVGHDGLGYPHRPEFLDGNGLYTDEEGVDPWEDFGPPQPELPPPDDPRFAEVERLRKAYVENLGAGEPLKGIQCLEGAVMVTLSLYGDDAPAVWSEAERLVTAYNSWAMKFADESNYDAAAGLLDKADLLTHVAGLFAANPPLRVRLRAITLNNVGCYYKRLGRLHLALTALNKALKLELASDTPHNPATTHLNLSAVLSLLKKHQGSLKHAECALMILEEEEAAREQAWEAHRAQQAELEAQRKMEDEMRKAADAKKPSTDAEEASEPALSGGEMSHTEEAKEAETEKKEGEEKKEKKEEDDEGGEVKAESADGEQAVDGADGAEEDKDKDKEEVEGEEAKAKDDGEEGEGVEKAGDQAGEGEADDDGEKSDKNGGVSSEDDGPDNRELEEHYNSGVSSITDSEVPSPNAHLLAIAYYNIGVQQEALGSLQESVEAYQVAASIAEKAMGSQHAMVATIEHAMEKAQIALRKSQIRAEQIKTKHSAGSAGMTPRQKLAAMFPMSARLTAGATPRPAPTGSRYTPLSHQGMASSRGRTPYSAQSQR